MAGHRFESLFARASARSMDLKQLAGEASKIIPMSSQRRRKFMDELFNREGAPMKETVQGTESRSGAIATFNSTARLGHALGGGDPDRRLAGAPYLAAMYSFALDEQARAPLYSALRMKTAEIAQLEQWPERIPGVNGSPHHYQDELTALVLDVDWLKQLFYLAQTNHNVNLYAIAMDLSEEVWQTKVTHYYIRILRPYEAWLARARGHVERRLQEEFNEPERKPKRAREAAYA